MKDGDSFPLSPDEVRMIEARRAKAAMLANPTTLTAEGKKEITDHVISLIYSLAQLAGKVDSADSTIHEIIHILASRDGG